MGKDTAAASTAKSVTPKWFNLYGDFIAKNAGAVSQIESGLRSLTYIIPGRYRESDIASEAVHSGVQVLSLYHDRLLSSATSKLPPSQKSPPTPHTRYTKFWTQRSPIYRRLATLLQVVQYTELLWEMAAKRKGERVRWSVVVLLEAIKAICRLLLLRLTNSRPLLSPPLPAREDLSVLEDPSQGDPEHLQSTDEATTWSMPRTGLSLPSLPATSDISSYLLSRVLTADDVKPAKALLPRISGKGEIAEWLYILRPVIYAIAMARCSQDKRNWRPWLLGFGIEFGARQLAKQDVLERAASGRGGLTALEREELARRGWGMAWWAMRGAFYENVTKSWVHGITGKMRGKLLLDMVGTIIEDYEFLWDQYYFPTATM